MDFQLTQRDLYIWDVTIHMLDAYDPAIGFIVTAGAVLILEIFFFFSAAGLLDVEHLLLSMYSWRRLYKLLLHLCSS